MDTAEQLAQQAEPLPWAEICTRYPISSCAWSFRLALFGNGATDDEAFEPSRDLDQRYLPFLRQVHRRLHRAVDRPAVVVIT